MAKNLGIVTAYGFAKAGGYTGTQAEFEEMIANVSDALNVATSSATSAAASASQANAILARATSIGNKRFAMDYLYNGSTTVSTLTFNPSGYVYSNTDIFSIYVDGNKLNVGTNLYTVQSSGNAAVITFNSSISVDSSIEVIADTEVPLTTDTTLTLSGAAADAKTVGDKLDELREMILNLSNA